MPSTAWAIKSGDSGRRYQRRRAGRFACAGRRNRLRRIVQRNAVRGRCRHRTMKWSSKGSLWMARHCQWYPHFGDLSGNVYALEATAGQTTQTATVEAVSPRRWWFMALSMWEPSTSPVCPESRDRPAGLGPTVYRARWRKMLVTPVPTGDLLLVLPNRQAAIRSACMVFTRVRRMAWRYPPAQP
jgi:hypothetical protein